MAWTSPRSATSRSSATAASARRPWSKALLYACGRPPGSAGSTTAPPPPTSTPTRSSARSRSTPRWPSATGRATASTSIDTPGYGDFVADARAGLRVAEAAVVVVDAVAGVQVQTEKVWKFANDYELPRAIVINRLDRERADFYRTLESLQKRLKGRLVPLQLPIGEEAGFSGVVDLIAMQGARLGRRQAEGGRDPGRPRREREVVPREAGRGRRRDRRRPARASTWRRARSARRRCWAPCAAPSCRASSCRCSAPPRRAASASGRCSTSS